MDLKSVIQKFVDEFGLKYHIYNDEAHSTLPLSVKLEFIVQGHRYVSWGVSEDRDLAFFKALMEIVERVSLNYYCPFSYRRNFLSSDVTLSMLAKKFNIRIENLYPNNSNGMAIGISKKMAKKSAKAELIERHTILTALLLGIKPKKIESSFMVPIDGHDLNFYYWQSTGMFTVVCLDKLAKGGCLTTHACSKDLLKAVKRSYEEIIPNIIFDSKTDYKPASEPKIQKNDLMSFAYYWKYSTDTRLQDFLEGGNNHEDCKVPSLKNIFIGECEIPTNVKLFSFPVFCYRAISPEAQQLFFDVWREEYINPLYKTEKLPDFPHFIS